jgi:hypothetical protein
MPPKTVLFVDDPASSCWQRPLDSYRSGRVAILHADAHRSSLRDSQQTALILRRRESSTVPHAAVEPAHDIGDRKPLQCCFNVDS